MANVTPAPNRPTTEFDPATFERDGFAVVADLIDEATRRNAIAAFDRIQGRAGSRNALAEPEIATLAAAHTIQELARDALGPEASCVRAILFNKNEQSNWRVRWHQDTVIQVSQRFDEPGWTAWSEKEGQTCVRPPADILERRIAIREQIGEVSPQISPAGALIIRPLLLHASSKATTCRPRRVVHLEFGLHGDAR